MAENILHSEVDLVLRVSKGDEKAFRQLFDLYRNKIYSLGMYLTRSETLAEEMVQDVFMKVWENRTQLASVQYFNAWLRTVARNTCSNYLRAVAIEKLTMNKLLNSGEFSMESAENELITKEIEQIIHTAIQQLPPQQKKVYLLSRQLSRKQEEIARELNISVYTVKEYMKLAQRSIRRHLENRVEIIALAAISAYLQ